MKYFLRVQTLALVAAGLLGLLPRAGAQGLEISVAPSAGSILVSNSLTYTINLTNVTGVPAPLADVLVTNLLPSSVLPLTATNSQGSVTNYGSVVVFDVTNFFNGSAVQLFLVVQPTAAGSITNTVTVFSAGVIGATNSAVVQVTNPSVLLADLGVTMTGSAQPAITNDLMVYGLTVSNAGPNAAPGVLLTNTLPAGVGFLSASPAGLTPAVTGSNVVFNLGTLAVGAFTNLLLTVQPTNAGVLAFTAFVISPGVTDPNFTNNSASTNITVTDYLPGQLVVFNNASQSTNFISGLLEQTITVSNAGPDPVSAARVVVSGLTNRLFNAVGTNSGNPFVVYTPPSGAVLAGGQTVDLLLQFFPRRAFPLGNSQLQAFAVPVPNWTPPPTNGMSTNINYTRVAVLPNGNLLIEWSAISNRSYTVVYSDDDPTVSDGLIAPPAITAPANVVEWIDYGPPTTSSKPASATNRFYKVYLNP